MYNSLMYLYAQQNKPSQASIVYNELKKHLQEREKEGEGEGTTDTDARFNEDTYQAMIQNAILQQDERIVGDLLVDMLKFKVLLTLKSARGIIKFYKRYLPRAERRGRVDSRGRAGGQIVDRRPR
jgi:hypothetical protein